MGNSRCILREGNNKRTKEETLLLIYFNVLSVIDIKMFKVGIFLVVLVLVLNTDASHSRRECNGHCSGGSCNAGKNPNHGCGNTGDALVDQYNRFKQMADEFITDSKA